jgi:lipoprotein
MKILKYLTVILAAVLAATGCYDDKGSYYTGSWTDIAAVEGMSIPGIGTNYYLNLVEEETLSLNPTVRFKPGVDESLFTYDWVMGGDTIASGLKLNWTVMRTNKMEFNQSGQTSFWLAINNKKSGENWRYYLQNDAGNLLKVTIAQVMAPKVGVFVYEKEDGSVEWGSVKGANAATPEAFTTLYTDIFAHYNAPSRMEGSVVGTAYDGSQLIVYTDQGPDHGAMVQTSEASTNPLGLSIGTVSNLVFDGVPEAGINGQSFYKGNMQEMLVGNSLFIGPTNNVYQMILSDAIPTQDGVVQIMGANPYANLMHFSVQRMTSGELWYYRYDSNRGYLRQILPDENGTVLKADRIIGVFRQPTFIDKQIKMFVAVKAGAAYQLHTYTYEQKTSGSDIITYVDKKDITSWAGGMSDDCTMFTNGIEVPLNYLYIAKGRDLWRTSYESQTAPQVVKSFPAPISAVEVVITSPNRIDVDTKELYTAVFTYDAGAKTSKMYVLDAKTDDLKAYSEVETAIPGKVVCFRANQ